MNWNTKVSSSLQGQNGQHINLSIFAAFIHDFKFFSFWKSISLDFYFGIKFISASELFWFLWGLSPAGSLSTSVLQQWPKHFHSWYVHRYRARLQLQQCAHKGKKATYPLLNNDNEERISKCFCRWCDAQVKWQIHLTVTELGDRVKINLLLTLPLLLSHLCYFPGS